MKLSDRIIGWQRVHGRHDLPWQNTQDPYRVWLSEIMLQQTQVSAVLEYYQRFLRHFPNVAALANASSEAVMAQWAGLGYYARARNLHACAQRIMSQWHGVFPGNAEGLATLPGIGPSTAAAIAAFCYGERAAIMDGNVKRVFAMATGTRGASLCENVLRRPSGDASLHAGPNGSRSDGLHAQPTSLYGLSSRKELPSAFDRPNRRTPLATQTQSLA